jgi:purine-binding chemotaxis protein CheW
MSEKSYLTFTLNNSLYGIDTFLVEEVFFLPELTPIPEAPLDIVGVVNLRGDILPIMDLNIRLGYRSFDYQLTDSIIVLKSQNYRIGIIVNQVHEVLSIEQENITPELSYGRELKRQESHDFTQGIARYKEDIVIILNVENLVNYVETQNLDASEKSLDLLKIQDQITEKKFFVLMQLQKKEKFSAIGLRV